MLEAPAVLIPLQDALQPQPFLLERLYRRRVLARELSPCGRVLARELPLCGRVLLLELPPHRGDLGVHLRQSALCDPDAFLAETFGHRFGERKLEETGYILQPLPFPLQRCEVIGQRVGEQFEVRPHPAQPGISQACALRPRAPVAANATRRRQRQRLRELVLGLPQPREQGLARFNFRPLVRRGVIEDRFPGVAAGQLTAVGGVRCHTVWVKLIPVLPPRLRLRRGHMPLHPGSGFRQGQVAPGGGAAQFRQDLLP